MTKCAVEGCCSETFASGRRPKRVVVSYRLIYCRKHCQWLDKYGSLEIPKQAKGPLEFRFWKHVEKGLPDECWNWTADLSRSGYGGLWDNSRQLNLSAHRFSYELHHGPITEGMQVMHSCDNKRCVNPNHLSLGTALQNTRDAVVRGLRKPIQPKYGEQNPKSKLTLEQVKFIRANPQLGLKQIADMWGLSPNCIRGVRIGRTWKDA